MDEATEGEIDVAVFDSGSVVSNQQDAYAQVKLGTVDVTLASLVKDDVPDWARQLANRINTQRRETYADLAQRTPGTTVREVGIIAGRKLIDRASAGHYVMNEQAQWVIKR